MPESNCLCHARIPQIEGTDVLASVRTRSDVASFLRPSRIKPLNLWKARLLHCRSVSMATYRFLEARASCRHTRSTHMAPCRPSAPPQLHHLTSDVGHMWLQQDLFVCLSALITPLSTLSLQRGVVGEVCRPLMHYPPPPHFFFLDCSRATFMQQQLERYMELWIIHARFVESEIQRAGRN